MASEAAEEGAESNVIRPDTEQATPRDSDKTEGGRDEASIEEELDGLLRMDIQNVDVDHGFGAECFRAEAFSW